MAEIRATDLRVDVFRTADVAGTTCAPTEHRLKVTHLPSGITLMSSVLPGESDLEVKSTLVEELQKQLDARTAEATAPEATPWEVVGDNLDHLRALLPGLERHLPPHLWHLLRVDVNCLDKAVREQAADDLSAMGQQLEADDHVRNALTHLVKLHERFTDGTIAEGNSSALDCLSAETAAYISDAWDDVNYHAEHAQLELRAVVGAGASASESEEVPRGGA